MEKPLIAFKHFIQCPQFLGDGIKLRPLQEKILVEYWSDLYSMAVWCLGRRSGKTFMAAACAVYACTAMAPVYKQYLRPGEPYYVLFVANNEEQAKIALEQVKIFVKSSTAFKRLIHRENATSISLANGAIFKAVPNTAKGIRGYPVALAILDEAAHYRTGAGEQTGEQLYQAIAPAIAQFGDYGRMILISTPWTKQGIFYDNYQKGLSGDFPEIHTANYPTWEVNTTISKQFLESAKKRDPILFEVEYGANFSVDFAAFLDATFIENAVKQSGALAPQSKFKYKYFCALDPALSGDAFTAAIGHVEGKNLVIDKLHEFLPTFHKGNKTLVDIRKVEDWILEQHNLYGFRKIVLDQYQSAATIQRLTPKLGSKISELTWTHNTKIEAYSYLKELFHSEKIYLYPHEKAIAQLKNLQVHYTPGGNWTVSGGSGIKVDDYCSVIAAIAYLARDTKDVNWAKYA